MYKLLIVDDEPLVQVGIKSMLPWASMNIVISGIASNGKTALELIEQDMPDIVVVGFDMTLTYEKLERVCTYIRRGAMFLATHKDINCPTEDGFIPDCGAMCAAITLSTGVEPKYLGKPCSETLDMVIERTGYKKEEIAFVGDRIYTDVATGVNNGAVGILVLSGETKKEDIPLFDVRPDGVFASLGDMIPYLQD